MESSCCWEHLYFLKNVLSRTRCVSTNSYGMCVGVEGWGSLVRKEDFEIVAWVVWTIRVGRIYRLIGYGIALPIQSNHTTSKDLPKLTDAW